MNALVIYDTQFGNTEQIAQAIAGGLGEFGQARAVHVNRSQEAELREADLLVLGSPTVAWNPTPAMQAYLKGIAPGSLSRLRTACFDTRMRLPRLLSRSAAGVIAKRLKSLGVELLLPAEGFFVIGREGPLRIGELERAADWGRTLRDKYEASQPRPAAG